LIATFIIKGHALISIKIVDTNTVDLGNIIVKTVCFDVEDEIQALPSSSVAMERNRRRVAAR
jgi:hypothetical protein